MWRRREAGGCFFHDRGQSDKGLMMLLMNINHLIDYQMRFGQCKGQKKMEVKAKRG